MDAEVTAECDVEISLTDNRRRRSSRRHGVKCFKHCTKFVFCFELPDCCPVCEANLLTSEINVPPFLYKSPLEPESHHECAAVLVRPSRGKSFLHDYGNGDFLHCGLLDENGIVHDFDERGISTSEEWLNCIHIPLDYPIHKRPVKELIEDIKVNWAAKHARYDSETANCFSFVLYCLRSLGLYTELSEAEYVSEVILPRTSEAARYIALYRQLVNNGGIHVKDSEHFYM